MGIAGASMAAAMLPPMRCTPTENDNEIRSKNWADDVKRQLV